MEYNIIAGPKNHSAIIYDKDNIECCRLNYFGAEIGYEIKSFFPFRSNDDWYAIYSDHSNAIKVMRLPSCKCILDISEPLDIARLFPGSFYIPRFFKIHSNRYAKDIWIGEYFSTEYLNDINDSEFPKRPNTYDEIYQWFNYVHDIFRTQYHSDDKYSNTYVSELVYANYGFSLGQYFNSPNGEFVVEYLKLDMPNSIYRIGKSNGFSEIILPYGIELHNAIREHDGLKDNPIHFNGRFLAVSKYIDMENFSLESID